MGAYNVFRTVMNCPACARELGLAIQFKFGDTYQYEYALGDELRWGGNDVGPQGKAQVVVDGSAEGACSECGRVMEVDYYIYIDRNRLARSEVADGKYDFISARAPFIVVRE